MNSGLVIIEHWGGKSWTFAPSLLNTHKKIEQILAFYEGILCRFWCKTIIKSLIFRCFISKSLRLRYTPLTFSSFANNARKRVNICKNRARFVCIFQKKQQFVLIFCGSPFGDLWRWCFFFHSGGVDELSFEGLPNQSHLIQTKKAASHESVNRLLLVKSKVLCCFILAYVCYIVFMVRTSPTYI